MSKRTKEHESIAIIELPVARKRKAGGFTLIELLVVIAIISLLVSILVPSLARVRELARDVICLSTLRGLVSANGIYGAGL